MGNYIGVDLHKNMFVVCILSESGEKIGTRKYRMSELNEFKNSLNKTDELAVEVTGNTRYFVGEIKNLVKAVKVVNPSQFKVISETAKKNDIVDAEKIAFF